MNAAQTTLRSRTIELAKKQGFNDKEYFVYLSKCSHADLKRRYNYHTSH